MNTNLGRTELAVLTNQSGGAVIQGDVVVVDTGNANSFTTTTTGAFSTGRVGVVYEIGGIASGASGLIAFGGYVPKITLQASAGIGELIKTYTTAKQGNAHAAPVETGDFAQALETGTSPEALLFGSPVNLVAGGQNLVQVVQSQTSAVQTGTTTIPHDDTIPQNTEGTEFMTLAITPESATNVLHIDATLNIANSTTTNVLNIMALFQDTTAGALAVASVNPPGAAGAHCILRIQYSMVAGTTSATTFKIRAGGASASTVTINGHAGAREFGGVMYSSMKITEVLP